MQLHMGSHQDVHAPTKITRAVVSGQMHFVVLKSKCKRMCRSDVSTKLIATWVPNKIG